MVHFNATPVVVDFVTNSVNTCVVPLIRDPETVKLTAVVVPVNAGLAKGAFNDTSVVVAFVPNSVKTLVVPLLKRSGYSYIYRCCCSC